MTDKPQLTPEQFREAAMSLQPDVRATAIGMVQVVEVMDRMTGQQRMDTLVYLRHRYIQESPRPLIQAHNDNSYADAHPKEPIGD